MTNGTPPAPREEAIANMACSELHYCLESARKEGGLNYENMVAFECYWAHP